MRDHACDSGETVWSPLELSDRSSTATTLVGRAPAQRSPQSCHRRRRGKFSDAAGELLRALAAPVRIAIVLQLHESQRCVHELVDALGVPQPLVSQHLKILKAAGVVAGERSGREVLYRLADHHLAHIVVDAVAHAGEDKP